MLHQLQNKKLAKVFAIALCFSASLLFYYYLRSGQDAFGIQDEGFLGPTDSVKHPIELLVKEANQKFKAMKRQSTSFEQAVKEYKRRYRREPPLGFNHWYDAAVKSNATIIDNFDTIMATLEPFWGLSAQEIRARVHDIQDLHAYKLVSISIKDHNISYSAPHEVWAHYKYEIIGHWVQPYLQFLPDMDFVFSTVDETRVVVPRDELDINMKRCSGILPNHNSSRMAQRVPIYLENLANEKSWMTTTLSCPADSPIRSGTKPPKDDGLYFVRNVTLVKDSCEDPSVLELHAGFGPKETASFLVKLHPIFSRSKISTYQDLLFPASDYAPNGAYTSYNASQDTPWEEKSSTLYWAGGTSGAEMRTNNGWRNWQRQRLVAEMNDRNRKIWFLRQKEGRRGRWEAYEDQMNSLSHMIDVSFTDARQCDTVTCATIKQEMRFNEEDQPPEAVYHNRFVIDVDGNAFTERFYRLLMSNSTVFKTTMYQEWHDDRLMPWVHYVPISLKMTELPETLRFLAETEKGRQIAKNIAEQGSEWAIKVLRNEDMGLAVFRTLLEYGRLYGEERDRTGECPWNRENG